VDNTNTGSGTRPVKRVRIKRIAPTSVSPQASGSELLENVSVADVEQEIKILRATGCREPDPQTPLADSAKSFVVKHYSNGRNAAKNVDRWLAYAAAVAVISTVGFAEGLVTAVAFGVAFGVCWLVGFVVGLLSSWRKNPQPPHAATPHAATPHAEISHTEISHTVPAEKAQKAESE
jgi:hypothetical protein